MVWAENRASWRHDPSADPGTKTEGGGRCRPVFPFEIGTNAVNRGPPNPASRLLIPAPGNLHFTSNHYTMRALVHYLYGSRGNLPARLVATFGSEQQLLAYVRWATLQDFGGQRGKFEQGSALAGYDTWQHSTEPMT